MFPNDLLQEPAVLHEVFIHTLNVLNSKDGSIVLVVWMFPTIVLIEVNLRKSFDEVFPCVFVSTKQFRVEMQNPGAMCVGISVIVDADMLVQPLPGFYLTSLKNIQLFQYIAIKMVC